jgi:uncharacterized protein YpmB
MSRRKLENNNKLPLLLTLSEAVKYTGIGEHTLKLIGDNVDNNLIVWIGSQRKFKRKELEEFISNARYIELKG